MFRRSPLEPSSKPRQQELKGIEYGCTVDAVSLLMPELVRAREDAGALGRFRV